MSNRLSSFFVFIVILFSFTSFVSPELFLQYTVKMRSGFGNYKSDVEVYCITDWNATVSDDSQKMLCEIANATQDKAKVFFIDKADPRMIDIQKANLELLLNEKKQLEPYIKARFRLLKLLQQNPLPNSEEIKKCLEDNSPTAVEVSESECKAFSDLATLIFETHKLTKSPSILVGNVQDSRMKLFQEITPLSIHVIQETVESYNTQNVPQKEA